MTGARRPNVRRAVATAGALALLTALAACSNDDDPVAEPGPAASATAEPSAEPSATGAPDGSGPEAGKGVGAVFVRSVHLTSWAWGDPATKDPVVALIKAGKIDNVQLDIKDEDGIIGFDSQLPLAQEANLVYKPIRFDIDSVVKEIHDLGATVTGRIVAFRDPRLGKWAVNNGKMDMVIQDQSGKPYPAGNYGVGAFTNFANPDVIEYNVALGEEAAKRGFDSVMYDYIRRPENSGQVYPGIGDRTPSQAIVDFIATAAPRIRAAGASAGAAVYGISSFAPSSVAQDIPGMAKHLDYVSPMIYPSHWNKGEYSVASPVDQPYDIVKQSMMDFNRMVIGTDCVVVPWLQNFSWPKTYTASDVAAQIKAVKDTGVNSWFLWNDSSKVGIGAPGLVAGDPANNKPGQIVYSISKPGNKSEGTTDYEKAKLVFEAYQAWLEGGREGAWKNPLDESSTPAPTTGSESTGESSGESTGESTEASPDPSATATS